MVTGETLPGGRSSCVSMGDDGGVQALRHHVPVREPVVLDGARRQALEGGVPERVHDGGQALLARLKHLLGGLAFVVHGVYVGAVAQQRVDNTRRARVQLWTVTDSL